MNIQLIVENDIHFSIIGVRLASRIIQDRNTQFREDDIVSSKYM